MKWKVQAGRFIGEDLEANEVEEIIRSGAAFCSRFELTTKLPILISARAMRSLEPHIVKLSDGAKEVTLTRRTANFPEGDIGISCDPRGDDVPVSSLNIEFRDHYDPMTDRGIVWVFPGDPAIVALYINDISSEKPGMVTHILEAAEAAIKDKVLSHFCEQ